MKINVMFFDLGGVLVDVNEAKLLHNFQELTQSDPERVRAIFTDLRDDYEAFQRGHLEKKDFYKKTRAAFDGGFSFHSIETAYTDMFDLKYDIVEIAQKLSRQVRISLISNTDELHYEYILEKYPELSIFEQPTTSFQAHSLKPEPVIYRSALHKLGIEAQHALFIDDKAENIAGANAIGMSGILFSNAENLILELNHYNFSIH
jgi:HAD superfamily hydrolase (TIGR01509 family)